MNAVVMGFYDRLMDEELDTLLVTGRVIVRVEDLYTMDFEFRQGLMPETVLVYNRQQINGCSDYVEFDVNGAIVHRVSRY